MSKIDELKTLKERLEPLLSAPELISEGRNSHNQVTIYIEGQSTYNNVGPGFGPCINAAVSSLADIILARAKAEAEKRIECLTREAVEECKAFLKSGPQD